MWGDGQKSNTNHVFLTSYSFIHSQVGSAAATPAADDSQSVDIYVPSYELNQVSVNDE